MLGELKAYLKSFNILTEWEIDSFAERLRFKKIEKNDFFIREGAVCKEVAFIVSGLVRSFYYSSQGEEVTYCFLFGGSFLTAYSSFIRQIETPENIQALTDVTVYTVSRQEISALEKSSYNWLKFLKVLAEQEYVNLEKRVFMLQREPAEKRYKNLLSNHPEYLQMIPLNYLASYLGITQRHLSRIRKTVTI